MFYPGVSVITLAVADVARARDFYERAGWRRSQGASTQGRVYFHLNNVAFSLCEEAAMGAGACGGRERFRLTQNHGGCASVDAALRRAVAAGANVLSAGAPTPAGGYAALFADPDGHVWELLFDPALPPGADGTIDLPP